MFGAQSSNKKHNGFTSPKGYKLFRSFEMSTHLLALIKYHARHKQITFQMFTSDNARREPCSLLPSRFPLNLGERTCIRYRTVANCSLKSSMIRWLNVLYNTCKCMPSAFRTFAVSCYDGICLLAFRLFVLYLLVLFHSYLQFVSNEDCLLRIERCSDPSVAFPSLPSFLSFSFSLRIIYDTNDEKLAQRV